MLFCERVVGGVLLVPCDRGCQSCRTVIIAATNICVFFVVLRPTAVSHDEKSSSEEAIRVTFRIVGDDLVFTHDFSPDSTGFDVRCARTECIARIVSTPDSQISRSGVQLY